MKKHILIKIASLLFVWTLLLTGSKSFAVTGPDFVSQPPFVTSGAPPLVMLVMDRSHKLYYQAYNDASDLDDDGIPDIHYDPAHIEYYGYFDSYKCYEYSTGDKRFNPSSKTTTKKCSGANEWSGDFLNYISMSRMDTMRKVLFGGYRSTDTATSTILERTFIPQDAHSWGKEYTSVAVDGYDIAEYTPFTTPTAGTHHLFASTTLIGPTNPPLLRYALNNIHRIWEWVAKERPVCDDSIATSSTTYAGHAYNHADFETMLTTYATAANTFGGGNWLDYNIRNHSAQRYPSPTAANYGAIDGAGNPWGANYNPYTSGAADQEHYLAVFDGHLTVTTAGTYQFAVDGDDAVEVIIDGGTVNEKIIGYYGAHGVCNCTTHSDSVTLTAGTHHIEYRMEEAGGGDNYYLYWNGPDSGSAWQIIPAQKFSDLLISTYHLSTAASTITDLEVRVKVCDPAIGLEPNCKQYPDGNYKPIGILQRHGETLFDTLAGKYKTPRMYFGLMTGSYAKSTSGGVLRKKMSNISDEIETNTTGIFKSSVNGIIQTINKLRIYGYDYGSHSYNQNCGWITTAAMTEGQCRDWGTPIGEMMYETLRYFAGKKGPDTTQPAANFDYSGTTDDNSLGLPKPTWDDPYDKSTGGGFDYCAKPIMLVLSDINPSYDSDQLPGIDTNFPGGITGDLTGLNVKTLADQISTGEEISGNKFIGQSGSTFDGVCTEKSISGFGSIRGLCPEEPTKKGSYYAAAVALYGHTTDLQPSATVKEDQKVTTYAVGLASPLPRIELKIGPQKKLVTMVPFGKSVKSNSDTTLWGYSPTNTIVNVFFETDTTTYKKFRINYEDVEQGADHDMDAIVTYEVQLIDSAGLAVADPLLAERVQFTLTSIYASGSIVQHLGYIISGTTADAPYLEVRDLDTAAGDDLHYAYDTGSASAPLPLTATRIFTPSAGPVGTAAQLLPNPLWYAAKWGAYNEKELSLPGPNLPEEWDKDDDKIPDTYFYVSNPLKLETQLNKAFNDIGKTMSSGTAASVISGSQSGEGAVYQSVFYPEKSDDKYNKITWAGSVHASFVDELGRMREDTNQNGILDIKDYIISFRKDGNTVVVDKYKLEDAVAEQTAITLPPAAYLTSNYFRLNTVGEEFYVWFTVDGIGTDPQPHHVRPHDITGIHVALTGSDDATTVATKTAAVLNSSYSAFTVVPATDTITITITNNIPGAVADATAETSSAIVVVVINGVGDTTTSVPTGAIKYLWDTTPWLNTITDADIITQRDYTTVAKQRHIFTFIDANQDKINDGETRNFTATSLPAVGDLDDSALIYPYIPVSSNSTTLPSYVNATNRDEFLQNQTQRVINYTRGLDQGATTLTTGGTIPAFRSRKLDNDSDGTLDITWRLGDIVHSSPTVVSKPLEALHLLYKDTTYATFAAKYSKRRTVVYAGANDGMMHAFNGGFYEDRFDVFPGNVPPAVPDGIKDISYLLQPKDNTGTTITTGFAAHPLGAELWAYVPYNLLPQLYWLTDPDYGHVYYVDLKPRVFDAKIFTPELVCSTDAYDAGCIHPDGWGTVLVGGMGFGGGKISVDIDRTDGNVNTADRTMSSAYFILDITNPEAPPVVLGEINFPQLGYTTCYPTVAAVKDKTAASPNNWYLIFGSGPAETDGSPGTNSEDSLKNALSNQKAKLYVVDLVKMAKIDPPEISRVLKTLNTTGALSATIPSPDYYRSFDGDNNAFISDPITVDLDLNYKADAVYFGTVSYDALAPVGTQWGGKLRRIVMEKKLTDTPAVNPVDPTKWLGDSVLMDLETIHHQPITAAPTVAFDSEKNNWVFFGTGRYFIRNDKDITDQQTYYGIKEPKYNNDPDINSYEPVLRSDMYDSTYVEVNATTGLVSEVFPPSILTPPAWTDSSWDNFVRDTKSKAGWYYNFIDPLERNIGQAALFADLLTFTTYVPIDDICAYGSSYLYALYYLTGTAPSHAAIHSSTSSSYYLYKKISLGEGLVSKPSIHVGKKDGSTIFVQSSDGSILTLDEENPALTKSGQTSWGYRQ
jgi:Tfp pilus tip-associated adhesin PilY1